MPDGEPKHIEVLGARTHNLRNVTVRIPRDRLVVITGLSGSGKSSLAFDTIYAEGQRKYVESLSAYARQFLEQMAKPDVDRIVGLPPTIAIGQQAGAGNPRSTVATTTEIYDYLRLLFARVGTPHCPRCGRVIAHQTVTQIVDSVLAMPERTRAMVLAPLVRGKKGEHRDVFARVLREGFIRVRVDGEVREIKGMPSPAKHRAHDIEAVVDRIVIRPDLRTRITESIETGLRLGDGLVVVSYEAAAVPGGSARRDSRTSDVASSAVRAAASTDDEGSWRDVVCSERYACTRCGVSVPPLEPRLFSFNSPHGACSACDGLGTVLEFDPELIAPEPSLPLDRGAIDAWRRGGRAAAATYGRLLREFCACFGVSPSTPLESLPKRQRDILMHGTTPEDEQAFGHHFEGVIPNLNRRWKTTESASVKSRLHGYLSERPCTACGGARLRPEALAVRVGGTGLDAVTRMSIDAAEAFFAGLEIQGEHAVIAAPILREVRQRLRFMIDVGIGYLTLNRASNTLSGGEAQRIRLATQVGSGLVGVCYVLDEPTIGLHQRDTARLIGTLRRLVEMGNTVLVVEHDADVIRAADWLIDVGPGAGAHGGMIVAEGTLEAVLRIAECGMPNAEHDTRNGSATGRPKPTDGPTKPTDGHPSASAGQSVTAKYLRGELTIEAPAKRRRVSKARVIEVEAAAENNLKSIDVRFPLGVFCCVTGVSGSGKSTLVNQVLLRGLRRRLHAGGERPGAHRRIVGASRIDKIIEIDQSPIGRTPRSNPATYTGVFDVIRDVFAKTREAKIRGYTAGRFSFNTKGGRCEACQGQGTKRIEMHFLPDIYVECDECKGARYGRETLEVKYRGRSISDVLAMRVEEAILFFDGFSALKQLLTALSDVGLSYIQLGQSSATLSGGEAQRVKLAAELGKSAMGHTLYVLDEPTTGLHFADIQKLLNVLNRLCDAGHSILVIEHSLDVIRQADWIIDLGPEGGDAGGRIVTEGTPDEIASNSDSHTGRYLRERLVGSRNDTKSEVGSRNAERLEPRP